MLAALVRFAVWRRGIVIALALLLTAYGAYRLSQASLDIFPEFAGKRVIVQTEAPGLSTEQVESLVSLPIERALGGLTDVEELRSESIQGLSVVLAVFDEDSDLYRDRQLVSERLGTLAGKFPASVSAPILVPLSSSSATILTLGLTSKSLSLPDLGSLVEWTVAPLLLAVPGVADVNVFGGSPKQLQLQVDPDRLWRYGIGLNEVEQAALQVAAPRGLGFLENANQRFGLQVSGLPNAPETVRNLMLRRGRQGNVTLGDVADIAVAPRPAFSAAAVLGEPAVVLMVIGQYGANTLSVSRRVEAALAELQPLFEKQGITVYPHLFRPADYIERSLQDLAAHLAIGGVLVIAVLYGFLFNLRAALIAACAIPLSLLSAVVVLLHFGVNLNIMVLGGLAIALGEVVDDAIIDTENIFRRLRENRRRPDPRPVGQVVYEASLEVRASVVYASFIVALVFVPLLTLGGVAGRLFGPLGYTYILAILMSLVTALTVTPALCYLIFERAQPQEEASQVIRALRGSYRRALEVLARRPRSTLTVSLGLCGIALAWLPAFGGEFLPKLREGHYIVHTASLPGTSLEESMRLGGRLTEAFRAVPGVASVSQWAGRAERGADTYGTHYSEYEVRLMPSSGSAQQTVLDRVRAILEDFPGIVFEANTFLVERVDETISGYTSPMVIHLYGVDLQALDDKGREVAALLGRIKGAAGVQLRSPPGAPLVDVRLRLDQLSSWGLRPLEVADGIQTAFAGKTVGKYFEGNRAYDIATILTPRLRRRVDDLARLPLRTPEGAMIPLSQVAEIRQTGGRYNILHRGARRVQTITSDIQGRDPDSFVAEAKRRLLSEIAFSAELYPEFTGTAVAQGEARRELFVHSLLVGAVVILLLYLAVGSVRNVALTLINLPFALVGGVAAALVAGGSLSVGSTVGFVTLFGITVRNSIMLISHYRRLVEGEGKPWGMATAVQGAEERLPAILMTALVTALAMLPIAIGSDNPGREIMGPMAAIIVGGLISSTALNLLALPAVLLRWGRFGD